MMSKPTSDTTETERLTCLLCYSTSKLNRTRFVRCVDNLKAIMMLLREGTSPITQYEAFCIFRIFVVNPHIPHVVRFEP